MREKILNIPELEQPVTRPALQTNMLLVTSSLSPSPVSLLRMARPRAAFLSAFLLLAGTLLSSSPSSLASWLSILFNLSLKRETR